MQMEFKLNLILAIKLQIAGDELVKIFDAKNVNDNSLLC